jgi:hypothetical protein
MNTVSNNTIGTTGNTVNTASAELLEPGSAEDSGLQGTSMTEEQYKAFQAGKIQAARDARGGTNVTSIADESEAFKTGYAAELDAAEALSEKMGQTTQLRRIKDLYKMQLGDSDSTVAAESTPPPLARNTSGEAQEFQAGQAQANEHLMRGGDLGSIANKSEAFQEGYIDQLDELIVHYEETGMTGLARKATVIKDGVLNNIETADVNDNALATAEQVATEGKTGDQSIQSSRTVESTITDNTTSAPVRAAAIDSPVLPDTLPINQKQAGTYEAGQAQANEHLIRGGDVGSIANKSEAFQAGYIDQLDELIAHYEETGMTGLARKATVIKDGVLNNIKAADAPLTRDQVFTAGMDKAEEAITSGEGESVVNQSIDFQKGYSFGIAKAELDAAGDTAKLDELAALRKTAFATDSEFAKPAFGDGGDLTEQGLDSSTPLSSFDNSLLRDEAIAAQDSQGSNVVKASSATDGTLVGETDTLSTGATHFSETSAEATTDAQAAITAARATGNVTGGVVEGTEAAGDLFHE